MGRKYYLRGFGLGIIVTALIMGIASPAKEELSDAEIMARAKKLGMVEDTILTKESTEEILDPKELLLKKEEELQTKESLKPEDFAKQPVEDDKQSENTAIDSKGDKQPSDADSAEEKQQSQTADNTAKNRTSQTADSTAKNQTSQTVDGTDKNQTSQMVDGTDKKQSAGTENTDNPTQPVTEKTDGSENTRTQDVQKDNAVSEVAADRENSNRTDDATITIVSGDSSYSVAKKLLDAGVISSAEGFDRFLCDGGYDKRLRTGVFTIPVDAGDEQIARIVTGME